ncbi:hypothetical protein [Zunongwangia sp. H14]|uniref:hypothetical protein n=1 Tax=Zunongwangia sp. H14 TaxID=3240792 RepID=UPI003569D717
MLIKQYIAITMLVVFSGKLITIDSELFSLILKTNEIVLLNPICEKKSDDMKKLGYQFKASSQVHVLKLARICSNNYQQPAGKDIPEVSYSVDKRFKYRKLQKSNDHSKKLYPPPKYSIVI